MKRFKDMTQEEFAQIGMDQLESVMPRATLDRYISIIAESPLTPERKVRQLHKMAIGAEKHGLFDDTKFEKRDMLAEIENELCDSINYIALGLCLNKTRMEIYDEDFMRNMMMNFAVVLHAINEKKHDRSH